MRPFTLTVLIASILAGCSSSGSNGHPTFSTHLGQDAALIARHVPECSDVTARGAGYLLPGATTAASCKIEGHTTVVFGWRTAKANRRPMSSLSAHSAIYARGAGWTEFPNGPIAKDAARLIASDFAKALGGKIEHA